MGVKMLAAFLLVFHLARLIHLHVIITYIYITIYLSVTTIILHYYIYKTNASVLIFHPDINVYTIWKCALKDDVVIDTTFLNYLCTTIKRLHKILFHIILSFCHSLIDKCSVIS